MELILELSVNELYSLVSEIPMGNLTHWSVWSLLLALAYGAIGYFNLAGYASALSQLICVAFFSFSVLLAIVEFLKRFNGPFGT